MAHEFAGSEWIDGLWAQLRSDEQVRVCGATWAHGPLVLVIEADEAASFGDSVALRLDLHEGEARDLRKVDPAKSAQAPFAIAGPYGRWKAAIGGSSGDLLDGILQGRLRVKGDLPTLQRHRELLAAILQAAARVETAWPDDVPVKEPAAAR